MLEHHYLIADDVDTDKIARMESVIVQDPYATVHVARSASEAEGLIAQYGKRIRGAAIDYDFIGEFQTGADIIHTLRTVNADARIALVTARTDDQYESASRHALSSGADATFSSRSTFEGKLGVVLDG